MAPRRICQTAALTRQGRFAIWFYQSRCSIFPPGFGAGSHWRKSSPPASSRPNSDVSNAFMEKTESQYQQVKAVFKQRSVSRYGAFRESLRIIIPYVWRRHAVSLARGGFGLRGLFIGAYDRIKIKRAPVRNTLRPGDFYEGVTLLPHLPASEVEAILNRPIEKIRTAKPDVICFSIVDWSFRFQRPQQLMSQFAANGHRVFYLNTTKFRSVYSRPKFHAEQILEN